MYAPWAFTANLSATIDIFTNICTDPNFESEEVVALNFQGENKPYIYLIGVLWYCRRRFCFPIVPLALALSEIRMRDWSSSLYNLSARGDIVENVCGKEIGRRVFQARVRIEALMHFTYVWCNNKSYYWYKHLIKIVNLSDKNGIVAKYFFPFKSVNF